MCHWEVSHAVFPPLGVSDLPWFWLWGLGSSEIGLRDQIWQRRKKGEGHMRHPHAQDTQPHSLVKGWAHNDGPSPKLVIGCVRNSLCASGLAIKNGELRFQCRHQNNRFQNKRHLLRKEWIYLKLRVTVPRKAQLKDEKWQVAIRGATFRSVSRLGEGCYAHFLV